MQEHENEHELKKLKELFYIPDKQGRNSLYLLAYRRLRELIIRGYYANGDKLMSEAELAGLMGIGRTSLRTALVLLAEDGYIRTFQGKGTYVVYDHNSSTCDYPAKYRLPKDRLASCFKNRTLSYVNIKHFSTDYDTFLDEMLKASGRPIHVFMRNYTVDGEPAILSNVYYPSKLFPGIDFKDFDKSEQLLEDLYHTKVSYVESNITAATSSASRKLNQFTAGNDNFILVSSVWYDRNGNPLVFTKDHYNGNYLGFTARFTK